MLQTYKEIKGRSYVLSKSEVEADVVAVMNSGSFGYSLFRYGLIREYPKSAKALLKK